MPKQMHLNEIPHGFDGGRTHKSLAASLRVIAADKIQFNPISKVFEGF
jgi:hypothetical protein